MGRSDSGRYGDAWCPGRPGRLDVPAGSSGRSGRRLGRLLGVVSDALRKDEADRQIGNVDLIPVGFLEHHQKHVREESSTAMDLRLDGHVSIPSSPAALESPCQT